MDDEKAEFRAALEAVRSGSRDAIQNFTEEYGPHIQRIARRNLDSRIQSKFDSLDFVQMVWVSFFRDPRQIRSFRRPADLRRYLGKLVRNKVCDEHRRRIISAKHNVTHEYSLQASDEPTNSLDLTPSQVAIVREEWQRIIEGEPPRNQNIARLRLGGSTLAEISRELGINERTVRRVIDRLLRPRQTDRKNRPDKMD